MVVTTALSGVCLWVPPALTCKDDLGAIWGFGRGMAIVVIPHPVWVARIAKQLVVSEKESVGHLLLDRSIGGLHAAQRQREQQCCQRRNQRSRHGQQLPSPRSPPQ